MESHDRIKDLKQLHFRKALECQAQHIKFKKIDLHRSSIYYQQFLYHKKRYDELQNKYLKTQEVHTDNGAYEIPISLKRITPVEDLKTNWFKQNISFGSLYKIKPKDEIQAIFKPAFVDVKSASQWLAPNQPVVAIQSGKEGKCYPLEVLIWHEIVNDVFNNVPIVVTYSPLSQGIFVYERSIENRTYLFGNSGIIEKSSTIMYDLDTESLWQTFTGHCIVGDLVGVTMDNYLCSTVPFDTFAKAYPEGRVVLSNETGFLRNYGHNPYVGYEDNNKPFLFTEEIDKRLPVMERVVGLIGSYSQKAYGYDLLKKQKIVEDYFEDEVIVIFYKYGMVSVLDEPVIRNSKDIGATAVFKPFVAGDKLTFYYQDNHIYDFETNSEWDLLGRAISGYYEGETLEWVLHSTPFWFAWAAYYPQTMVYEM